MTEDVAPTLGTRPFSISLGSKPKASSVTPAKRNRAAALGDDSDHEADDRERGPQAVTGFGDHGAVADSTGADERSKAAKQPLVIPVQRDADWRDPGARRSGRNLLPTEVQAQQRESKGQRDEQDADQEEAPQYGLVLKQRATEADGDDVRPETNGDGHRKEDGAPRTLDQEALDRLVSGEKKQSSLVIPGSETAGQNGFGGRRHEENDFRQDIASRPEAASLADYEAVPIEEFGAAMLRGMGWTEGGGVGRARKTAVQPRVLEKRPNLLGIGAKEVPEGLEELGAWGKAAKGKGPKTREQYNPVVLRNTATGETLTEEEKMERDRKQREEQENPPSKAKDRTAEHRDGQDSREERRRDKDERHRDRDRDRDRRKIRSESKRHEDDRYRSTRGHRSRSPEKGHSRKGYSRDRRDHSNEERQSSRRHRDDRDREDKHRHQSRRDDNDRDDERRRRRHRDEYDEARSRRR